MKVTAMILGTVLTTALLSDGAQGHAEDDPLIRPIAPDYAQRWLAPLPPVRVHGNSFSVGFAGLSVALIDTGEGLILIDGAVPQAVGEIEANVRRLGFRVEDVRYILSTEPHWDHAGGIAALARDSGAAVVASAPAAQVFRTGKVGDDDPQSAHLEPFPAVADVRAMADGETLRLGNTLVTARATPGHTAGSMSWTWRSCDGSRCLDMVFGASLNPVSADGYRFSEPNNRGVIAAFRGSFNVMRALPCDILITAHPAQSGSDEGYACKAYADRAEQALDRRLADEARRQP